ncbi:MAG: hypothetical protein OXB88_06525 [Bacteriovoracales bacterium]|nr:hypothetical protein [Bacteriovoracales bacterium]
MIFSTKDFDRLKDRLFGVSSSLEGLAGLFQHTKREMPLEDGELFGIGAVLRTLAKELSAVEDALCDHVPGEKESED